MTSILMKYLKDRGLLDGNKKFKFTILIDNSGGQNRIKFVLRLATYFVKAGYFKMVGFIFHVDGHTKTLLTAFSIELDKVMHEGCRQQTKNRNCI